jgi:hypothetical protein
MPMLTAMGQKIGLNGGNGATESKNFSFISPTEKRRR